MKKTSLAVALFITLASKFIGTFSFFNSLSFSPLYMKQWEWRHSRDMLHFLSSFFASFLPVHYDARFYSKFNSRWKWKLTFYSHYIDRDGQWRTIVSLINLGASITVRDARNQSPLHFGCRYGRYNTVKLLLEGPDGHLIINAMDGEGMSPLHISSEFGHTKVVQYLLVKGSLLQR